MKIVRTVSALRETVRLARESGAGVALVPTMGSLHAGHLSLIQQAGERCELVIVSVFVNPAQFGANEDLDAYPRDEEADARAAAAAGAGILFAPSAQEMYPEGFSTWVSVEGVSDGLCGGARGPEHFRGVATVVCKLLNIAAPDVALFGQKDAQQVAVIQRLVRDLNVPVRIEICPTVRDRDGLALSSRNAYLRPAERAQALSLSCALRVAAGAVDDGEQDSQVLAELARGELLERGVEPEYVELVSPETIQPVGRLDGPVLLAVAARVGRARLIDNAILTPRK